MISIEHLSKKYGAVQAVADVSFEVGKGEVVGFLGPNGAGKSTTLRIIAGFLGATQGRVRVAGFDIVDQHREARAALGYMPENVPLYPELRVNEYLRYRAELKQVPRSKRLSAVNRVIHDVRLQEYSDRLIGQLSRGYRQRVGLADALVSDPPVLVLDEPTAGLDPNQIREVRGLIRALGADRTVLLSTHILSEVEASCDRAVVIDRGRLVAQGTLDELVRERKSASTRFVVRGDADTVRQLLESIETAVSVQRSNPVKPGDTPAVVEFEVRWNPDTINIEESVERAVGLLAGHRIAIREVANHRASLEEVFAGLTYDESAAGEPNRQGDAS